MKAGLAGAILALALTLAVSVPTQLGAAEMPSDRPKMGEKMAGQRRGMMEHRTAMLAEMKSEDAELSTLVAAVKAAPADQKVELLTNLVARLVEQRAEMTKRMEAMPDGMMPHRAMGDEGKAPTQSMPGMDDKPDEAPKEKK